MTPGRLLGMLAGGLIGSMAGHVLASTYERMFRDEEFRKFLRSKRPVKVEADSDDGISG